MPWKDKRKYTSDRSIIRKLREEKGITEEFEVMLSSISFEDMIALKLALVSKQIKSGTYGLPIWKFLDFAIREGILKYVYTISNSNKEAASFLGMSRRNYIDLLKRYNIEETLECSTDRNEEPKTILVKTKE